MPAFAPTSAVQGIWQLEQIYIGYYGRAVEASGYSYWQNEFNARTNGTYKVANVTYPKQAAADAIASIAASFAPQSESIALYPFLGSNVTFPTTDIAIKTQISTFVTTVYQNLFGRAPDAAGLAYWVNQIALGRDNTSTAILAIGNAAGADGTAQSLADAAVLNNKIAVADNFLISTSGSNIGISGNPLPAVLAQARAVLTNVDSTLASVTSANAGLTSWIGSGAGLPGQTYNLTTGVDSGANFVGGTGSDVFNAGITSSLSSFDSLDGGAGTDTLTALISTSSLPSNLTIKSIEVANINTTAAGFADSFIPWAGLTALNLNVGAAGAVTLALAPTTGGAIVATGASAVTVNGGGGALAVTTGAAAVDIGKTQSGSNSMINGLTSVSVTGGSTVDIADNKTNSANAGDGSGLKSVSVNGNTGAVTIKGNGVNSLTITNGVAASDVTVTAAAGTRALGVTVNNDATGLVVTDSTATSVSITATGAASAIALSAGSATSLTLGGSVGLTLDTLGAVYTALTSVILTGAGGVTADLSTATTASAAAITSIDASASTGANNLTITATQESYLGGAGVDRLTIAAVPTKTLDGGAGSSDVLIVNAASYAGSTKVVNFESLGMGAAAAGTFDATGFSNLTVASAITGDSTFSNVAAGAALTIEAAPGFVINYQLKDATGTSDAASLNVAKATSTGLDLSGKAVDFTGVEALTLNSLGTGTGTNKVYVTDSALKSLVVTGGEAIALKSTGTTALASVDASTTTKGADFTNLTLKSGTIEIGGAGADKLLATGGLDSLTGGAGADTFFVTTASTNVNVYATITDATKGDIITLANKGTEVWSSVKLTLGATATFQDYANAVVNAGGNASVNGYVGWFQFAGDTYVVESLHNATTTLNFSNGTDMIVKLTGLLDLSTATNDFAAAAANSSLTLA
jgi:S-layer protein